MKTQLLEDIDDSGALPLRPRPAVWHRPRFDAGPAAPRVGPVRPDPVSAGPAAPTEAPASAPYSAPASPSAPEPAEPAAAPSPAQASAFGPEPGPRRSAPDMAQPDWLADILRQDAEREAASRRPAAWLPRVLVWGVAACALALLAAGGLWLFEERRADGALTVVAKASPAPAPVSRAMPSAVQAPALLPAGPAPVLPPAGPATARPPAGPAPSMVSPVPPSAAATTPAAALEAPAVKADAPAAAPVVRHERAPARAAASSKAKSGHGVSEQRQREETLVQCQAHGYDERQCVQRGCELTRYGLACRG